MTEEITQATVTTEVATPAPVVETPPAIPADPAIAPPETPAPLTAETFTMPEGFTMNDSIMADALPVFTELNLNAEQSQKLVDIYAKGIISAKTQAEAYVTEKADAIYAQKITEQAEKWKTEASSHVDIGGEKLAPILANATKALEAFGSSDLKAELNKTGYGNHPAMIQFMAAIGSKLGEGNNFIHGNTTSAAPQDKYAQARGNKV